jgi:hypothetical protein
VEDFYAPWEWLPINLMPNGCSEVEIRIMNEQVVEMCSCDCWWKSNKEQFLFFRFKEQGNEL